MHKIARGIRRIVTRKTGTAALLLVLFAVQSCASGPDNLPSINLSQASRDNPDPPPFDRGAVANDLCSAVRIAAQTVPALNVAGSTTIGNVADLSQPGRLNGLFVSMAASNNPGGIVRSYLVERYIDTSSVYYVYVDQSAALATRNARLYCENLGGEFWRQYQLVPRLTCANIATTQC